MSKRKQKQEASSSKGVVIFMVITVLIVIGFIVSNGSGNSTSTNANSAPSNAVTVTGDKQIVEITARGGYTPGSVSAKAGVPTILRMNSNGASGCERALRIASLGVSKTLPTNGNTDIDLGTQSAGAKIKGSCSMGMYTFVVNFI